MEKLKVNEIKGINNKDQLISYLTGVWLGDGIKKASSLSIVIPLKRETFATSILELLKKFYNSDVTFSQHSSVVIFSKCTDLTRLFKQEIEKPNFIFLYPYHFLCGVFDTDGSIWFRNTRLAETIIDFYNTNKLFICRIKEALNICKISWKQFKIDQRGKEILISGAKTKVNKVQYTIRLRFQAFVYICSKIFLRISLVNYKKERLEKFITKYEKFYENKILPVIETFSSINGEGISIGQPHFFIRLFGCNLNCPKCDTSYSLGNVHNTYYKPKLKVRNFIHISLKDLVEMVKESYKDTVCITGGEPTLHKYLLIPFVAFLRSEGMKVVLQTNGTNYVNSLFKLCDVVAVDIKSPSTGVKSKLRIISKLRSCDEVKTLIATEDDWVFAKKINKLVKRVKCTHVLQPFDLTNIKGEKERERLYLKKSKEVAERMLKENLYHSRLSLQIHKLVWGFNKRGI